MSRRDVSERGERVETRDPLQVSKGADGSARLRVRAIVSAPHAELDFVGAPTWPEPAVAVRVALDPKLSLAADCGARLWTDGSSSVATCLSHLPMAPSSSF